MKLVSRATILVSALVMMSAATAGQLPPPRGLTFADIEQKRTVVARKSELSAAEKRVDSQLLPAARWARLQRAARPSEGSAPELPPVAAAMARHIHADGAVMVMVRTTKGTLGRVVAALGSFGSRDIKAFPAFNTVSALVPLRTVLDIAATDGVVSIALPESAATIDTLIASASSPKAGATQWQGVIAHAADKAHLAGITGSNITVCVLSDGVDSLASRITAGELPASVAVLPGQQGSGDRGTAMLEIVHDMAPGAALAFATATGGISQFAQNIYNLHSAYSCDVMVDDFTYDQESAFQDGFIAQAIAAVTAEGVVYLSAAGNAGSKAKSTSGVFEGDFIAATSSDIPGLTIPAAIEAIEGPGVVLHRFGSGPGAYLEYTTLTAATNTVTLKWSDPLDTSSNDYDLFVMDATGSSILGLAGTNIQSGAGNPVETASCTSPCPFPVGSRTYVVKYSGAARALRLDTHGGRITAGDSTAGATFGHNAADSTLTVAGVSLSTAGGGVFVGGGTNPVADYSSDGPRRVFYAANGTALTAGNLLFGTGGGLLLDKVDITAGAGGSTSTPGLTTFTSTGAAASTAAGLVALARSAKPTATPVEIQAAIRSQALDIEATGTDVNSGSGIPMAPSALRALLTPLSAVRSLTPAAIGVGAAARFRMDIANPNAVTLTKVAYTETYPSGIVNAAISNPTVSTFVGSPGGCVASVSAAGTGTFVISEATIPASATCRFEVSVTSATAGAYAFNSGAVTTPILLNTTPASASLSVVADFALTAAKSGTGGGTITSAPAGINCGATCSASFAVGALITLTAQPDATSTFAGWSGGGCSGTNTCAVTMDAAKNVTATFTTVPGGQTALTVTKVGPGSGTVTSSPAGLSCGSNCSIAFTTGTSVVLTATATSGSAFAGWSGGGCTSTGTCEVTLDAAKGVTATFNLEGVLVVANQDFSDSQAFTTTRAITLGPAITVNSPFTLSLTAGEQVRIVPRVTVKTGATLTIRTGPPPP